MLGVAILSDWHVHSRGYAKEVREYEGASIRAVWDDKKERGQAFARDCDASFVSDLEALLSQKDIDGVVVGTATAMHPEVLIKAARAGKHIFTEKVLSITLAEGEEILKAVNDAKVKFTISFPHRTRPALLYAKSVLLEGVLGMPTVVRVRNAHNGAVKNWLPEHFYDPKDCGGGAMIDLGAHGMYLALWLLGQPKSVMSMFSHVTKRAVEDNAVSVLEFSEGALFINETGFVSANSPFSLEIYGTEGTLLLSGPEQSVRISTAKSTDWTTVTHFPPASPSPLVQWMSAILYGTSNPFSIEEALELTRVMEGAYISARTNAKHIF